MITRQMPAKANNVLPMFSSKIEKYVNRMFSIVVNCHQSACVGHFCHNFKKVKVDLSTLSLQIEKADPIQHAWNTLMSN